MVSLSSHLSSSSLILLRDGADRVEGLFRLVVDLDLDGAIVSVATPGGGRAAAAARTGGAATQQPSRCRGGSRKCCAWSTIGRAAELVRMRRRRRRKWR